MKKKKNNRVYAIALFEVIKGLKGEKLDRALRAFAALLARDHKLSAAPIILAEFEKYSKQQSGIAQISITSARSLKPETVTLIKDLFGKQTEETTAIDEDLLGGVVIKADDRIIDASLKTQLKKLHLQMLNYKN